MGIELISVIIAADGMTGICPQCKSLIPRDSSRFCYHCGMALRISSGAPGEEDQVDSIVDGAMDGAVDGIEQQNGEDLSPDSVPLINH
jgi:hypothetical protein